MSLATSDKTIHRKAKMIIMKLLNQMDKGGING